MIAHTSIHVSDFSQAKRFYSKALEPLGYTPNMEFERAAGFNDGKNTDFWIDEQDTVTPTHVAFEAKSKDEVAAFYEAALAAGGTDNGGPGYRRDYWPGYYAAFVRDLDGNNIEAVWYDYSAVAASRTRRSCATSTATTSKRSGTTTRPLRRPRAEARLRAAPPRSKAHLQRRTDEACVLQPVGFDSRRPSSARRTEDGR